MIFRFSDKAIQKLRPGASQVLHSDSDCPGLRIRINTSGKKVFVVQWFEAGKAKRKAIGEFPAMSVGEARAIALQAESGQRGTTRAEGAPFTLAESFAGYIEERRLSWAAKTYKYEALHFEKHVKPALGDEPLETLTVEKLDAHLERQPLKLRARLRRHIGTWMRWATDKGHLQPMPPLKKIRVTTRKERMEATSARSRFLGLHELRDVMTTIDQATQGAGRNETAVAFALIAATGARLNEVCDALWREIDYEAGVLRIPAERMKGGRPHTITLNSYAIRALNRVRRRRPDGRIFPLAQGENLRRWRVQHLEPLTSEPFVQHDFRRTMTTHLADLGVPVFVTDQMLSHVVGAASGGSAITRVYNFGSFELQTTEAWGLWGDVLEWLIGERPEKLGVRFDARASNSFVKWREERAHLPRVALMVGQAPTRAGRAPLQG